MKYLLIASTTLLVLSMATAQTKMGFMPIKSGVIDINRAYISPREFTNAFAGIFEPRTFDTLYWEYNGVQLLLKKGSTSVSSLLDQNNFNLMSPVTEKDGRTVLEASVVFRFNCSLARTNGAQLQLEITCGSGQTLQTQMLRRY
jgi:hypothetical protein